MLKLRALLLSLCATVVSVAIWTVVLGFNLLWWAFGDAAFVRPLAWALLVISAVVFQVIFYRHFNREAQKESPLE
jgi:hypothetical protein